MSESTKKVIGIVLLAFGVLWLLASLGAFTFKLVFRGWWTLIIIIPSIWAIVSNKNRQGGFIALGIGLILFLLAQFLSWADFFRFTLAILMVLTGISILMSHSPNLTFGRKSQAAYGKRDFDILIGRHYYNFNNEQIDHINCKLAFGILTLDLRNAHIDQDITIECDCTMASLDILLPSGVTVNQRVRMTLASTRNEHINICNLDRPQVTIKGSVTLGILGID